MTPYWPGWLLAELAAVQMDAGWVGWVVGHWWVGCWLVGCWLGWRLAELAAAWVGCWLGWLLAELAVGRVGCWAGWLVAGLAVGRVGLGCQNQSVPVTLRTTPRACVGRLSHF